MTLAQLAQARLGDRPLAGRACDLFCRVVDNYGDIGVTWRLARQLAREHGLLPRLWLDDWASLKRLCPQAALDGARQTLYGVEIRHWRDATLETPAGIVIETFSCGLPPAYLEAMARVAPAPVWVNLEYLSAEAWVQGCHGLPSPHPRLPLTCHFFYPGFVAGTGGLLREADLIPTRQAFQADRAAQAAFWQGLGLPAPEADELRVSLFAYDNPGVGELLAAWAQGPQPITALVPDGLLTPRVAAFFGRTRLAAGDWLRQGALSVHALPFLEQDHYDRLLWACDLNFVRGEDSFVRAQWAARPLVWHIYPQDQGAHWSKLEAFLEGYAAKLAPDARQALRQMFTAWNRGAGLATAWAAHARHWPTWVEHARRWAERLAAQADLASNLVLFIKNWL